MSDFPSGFSMRSIILNTLAVVIWIGTLIYPILTNQYLPFIDFPNHAARLYILANPDSPILASYYGFDLAFLGNSALDLYVKITDWQGDVYKLMRGSVVFYLVNFQFAALLLHYLFWKRFSLWPLVAGFAAYSAPLFWGFQNYFVSVPIALYVLAGWIASAHLKNWVRVMIFLLPVFVVYSLHSIAFALLALAIGGIEIERAWRGRDFPFGRRLLRAMVLAIPFVPPLIHFLVLQFQGDNGRGSTLSAFGNLNARLQIFESFFGAPYLGLYQPYLGLYHWVIPMISILIFLILVPVLLLLKKTNPKLRLASGSAGMLLVVVAATLLAPEWLAAVWGIHLRLGFALFLLFVVATRPQGFSTKQKRAAMLVFSLLLVLRVVSIDSALAQYTKTTTQVMVLLDQVDLGAPIRMLPSETRPWVFAHVDKYAVVQRQAFDPALFVGAHGFYINNEKMDEALSRIQQSKCEPNQTSDGYWLWYKSGPEVPNFITTALFKHIDKQGKFYLYEGCKDNA